MNQQELQSQIRHIKEERTKVRQKVCVCCGAGCISSGAEEVLKKTTGRNQCRRAWKMKLNLFLPVAWAPATRGRW